MGSRSVTELNQQRRRAVHMRQSGATLMQIHQATGLSAPTIIAAYRAFQEGGWQAVDTAKRGRRPALGTERLPFDAQASLWSAISRGLPQATAQGASLLWSPAIIAAWLRHHYRFDMPVRTAARLIRCWNLHAPSMLDEARNSDDLIIKEWLLQEYQGYRRQASQVNGQILWIGERSVPNSSLYQIFAHTPRGSMQFIVTQKVPTVDDWRIFLEGLCNSCDKKIFIVFTNAHLVRIDGPDLWLKKRRNNIATIYFPVCTPRSASHIFASSIQAKSSISTTRPIMPLTHLQRLEAESIHIMREVVAEAENPVMLYSIGKDSAVMLHLAMKAFYPAVPPFPLLHVDTRWKFRDMYAFRDKMAKELGMKLLVHVNPEGVKKDINPFTHGAAIHTDIMKTEGLKQALDHYKFDAAFGGARRDEEKSRAKERIFSFRTAQHRWDPKNQRPELWKLYNARKHKGESMRVFPLSNWTELDIWQYIYLERIPIVPLYFSARRPVVQRDGALIMVDDDRMPLKPGEVPMMKKVRFRTLGCYPLTGAIESEADTLPAIIQEMLLTRTSERQGRVIDHDSAASMEKKKQEGYF